MSILQLCVILFARWAVDSTSTNVDVVDVLSQLCSRKKNELGLLFGAEFIPRAATTSSQKLNFGRSVAYSVDYARRLSSGSTALLLEFPFAAGPSHRVESAKRNVITSLATLFVTPSLRAQFVSHAPVHQGYPPASDMNSTREVAYCKMQFGGE